jgi:predicted NAD/FAD-dependent oxidoreductase
MGMAQIAEHLAQNVDIRVNHTVTRFAPLRSSWLVHTAVGASYESGALVLTSPAPLALSLLETSHVSLLATSRAALSSLTYHPCLAALLLLEGPATIPPPGALQFSEGPMAWIADNHVKGISPCPGAFTIHASPEFSLTHWDSADSTITQRLAAAAADWLDSPIAISEVVRWRESKATSTFPQPFLEVMDKPPLLLAGDSFGGAKVEGAFLSGLAVAKHVLQCGL